MQIPEGHKFAAYFLSQCDVADDVPGEDVELQQQLGVRISGRIATEVEPLDRPIYLPGSLSVGC
jgi:hypothetical protein